MIEGGGRYSTPFVFIVTSQLQWQREKGKNVAASLMERSGGVIKDDREKEKDNRRSQEETESLIAPAYECEQQ